MPEPRVVDGGIPPKFRYPNDYVGMAFPIYGLAQFSLAQLQSEFDAYGLPPKRWPEQFVFPNVAALFPPPVSTPLPLNAIAYLFDKAPPKVPMSMLALDGWYQNFPGMPPPVVGITSAYDERYVVHILPRAFTVSIPDPTISYRVL